MDSFAHLQQAVNAYLEECQKYGVNPNSGVLVALRFHLDVLRPTKPFHCKDVMPLAEVLIRLSEQTYHITRADFSLGMSPSHARAGACCCDCCAFFLGTKRDENKANETPDTQRGFGRTEP
jgi:hypothetical protein